MIVTAGMQQVERVQRLLQGARKNCWNGIIKRTRAVVNAVNNHAHSGFIDKARTIIAHPNTVESSCECSHAAHVHAIAVEAGGHGRKVGCIRHNNNHIGLTNGGDLLCHLRQNCFPTGGAGPTINNGFRWRVFAWRNQRALWSGCDRARLNLRIIFNPFFFRGREGAWQILHINTHLIDWIGFGNALARVDGDGTCKRGDQ